MVLVTHSIDELLLIASKKFAFTAKKVFTAQGGEIDDIKLLRDDDILYVTGGEPFISVDVARSNLAPSAVLKDSVRKAEPFGQAAAFSHPSASSSHQHHCSAQFSST